MDLRYPPLSPTAAPIVVCQNSVYASLDPLDVVRLPLILGTPNPGIADSLLTVSISNSQIQNPSNSHCIGTAQSCFWVKRIANFFHSVSSCKQFISAS